MNPTPPAIDPAFQEHRPCPRCASTSSDLRITGRDHQLNHNGPFYVSRCRSCGLLFQNPSVRADQLAGFYPPTYGPYSDIEMTLPPAATWYLHRRMGYTHLPPTPIPLRSTLLARWVCGTHLMPRYTPDGRLLEIACAGGGRLLMLRKLGWNNCLGIEYSDHAAQIARSRGLNVQTGSAEQQLHAIDDASLDVVIASFVLEHLADPFAVVEQIAGKLRPGGQFLFSTLDVNSLDFHLYQQYWYDLDLPRHFTFFTRRDIHQMVATHFHVEGVFHQAVQQDFWRSAEIRYRHRPNAFDRAVRRMGDRLRPLALLLAMLHRTSRICIHARRK